MEKFKKTLKRRMLLTGVYCLIIVALVALGLFRPGDSHVSDNIAGMSLGLCTGLGSVAIYNVIRIALALRSEEKLKKLYISETDERLTMIRTKAGGTGLVLSVAGLLLGAMVAGYLNATVFFTLVGASLFVALVVICLKGYYWVKYSK